MFATFFGRVRHYVIVLTQVVAALHCGEEKLRNLKNMAALMMNVADEMALQNKKNYFENQFQFLEEIVDEMLRVTDVDFTAKCEKIACCFCYNETDYYAKTIEENKRTICFMKFGYGDEAKLYEVLGHCYHNLEVTYKKR
ncbi:unnamed protein product [Clavelina lepadiformis]|uniref:Uncharacterized protein n=1 Tax=Clavelina lepadiformis TaxID=159417 RepID=A0ABP0EZW1_CLALP